MPVEPRVITSTFDKIVRTYLYPNWEPPEAVVEVLDRTNDGWRLTTLRLNIHELDRIRNELEPPEVR